MISVIVPCFNEKNTIEEIVYRIQSQNFIKTQIIIVDDGSTDGTREILRNKIEKKVSKIIYNNTNNGKGYAIRCALPFADKEIILIQDADLEYNPSDYENLINPILKGFADVVYGSRFTGYSEKRVLYFWHTFGNKLLTLLSNIFTDLNLTDMEVGYKVFRSEVIKNLNLEENRFGFEPEITAKISKMNLTIYEVGISYSGRKYNEGKKITWRDGFSAIRSIIKHNLFR